MKNKKLKQILLAFACILTMMSAKLPAAAEEIESEDAYLTVGIIGNCGCQISTMDYMTVSRRSSVVIDSDKTHVSYNITYICPKGHGIQSTARSVKGTHLSGGPYEDCGHRQGPILTHEDLLHFYRRYCSCGAVSEEVGVRCMASPSAIGGHGLP